ncbi:GNAT family N-acetyltransferase [Kocuria sp.]|uniref:GNAT family N-acetyltransferase n=1 Tax=Kocuria sp. TaxID=1871328 RepID=UPI0026DD627C|nr:GNAT family N-acetyltransferase [Kocuria sp.]MDO4919992.1 GNAT family N-acetyltransferase [Kocuria sp.]
MTHSERPRATDRPPFEIVRAVPGDTGRAAETLAAAFAVDPHVVGLLPHGDVDASLTRLWRRIVTETFQAGGHVYLALAPDRPEPLGVTLWEAPGSKVSLRGMLPGLSTYLRIFRTRFADAMTTEYLAHRAHPEAPHWYLKAVGTLPQARGAGVGDRLIRSRLAEVDREGTGAYLEASTEDLVPFYGRFGFERLGPVPCRGTVPAVGMWRPPAR